MTLWWKRVNRQLGGGTVLHSFSLRNSSCVRVTSMRAHNKQHLLTRHALPNQASTTQPPPLRRGRHKGDQPTGRLLGLSSSSPSAAKDGTSGYVPHAWRSCMRACMGLAELAPCGRHRPGIRFITGRTGWLLDDSCTAIHALQCLLLRMQITYMHAWRVSTVRIHA